MAGKDDCRGRPQASTRSDILYFLDQRNLIFIMEKLGKKVGEFRDKVSVAAVKDLAQSIDPFFINRWLQIYKYMYAFK